MYSLWHFNYSSWYGSYWLYYNAWFSKLSCLGWEFAGAKNVKELVSVLLITWTPCPTPCEWKYCQLYQQINCITQLMYKYFCFQHHSKSCHGLKTGSFFWLSKKLNFHWFEMGPHFYRICSKPVSVAWLFDCSSLDACCSSELQLH